MPKRPTRSQPVASTCPSCCHPACDVGGRLESDAAAVSEVRRMEPGDADELPGDAEQPCLACGGNEDRGEGLALDPGLKIERRERSGQWSTGLPESNPGAAGAGARLEQPAAFAGLAIFEPAWPQRRQALFFEQGRDEKRIAHLRERRRPLPHSGATRAILPTSVGRFSRPPGVKPGTRRRRGKQLEEGMRIVVGRDSHDGAAGGEIGVGEQVGAPRAGSPARMPKRPPPGRRRPKIRR